MLMRYDPYRTLDRLIHQPFDWGASSGMPMDAHREEGRYVVTFDLPGVDPSAVEVTVQDNILKVAAERSAVHERAGEAGAAVIAERRYGRFERQVSLGERVDVEKIEATYDNGVLTVVVPVAESARSRKIAIGTGQRQAASVESRSGDSASAAA